MTKPKGVGTGLEKQGIVGKGQNIGKEFLLLTSKIKAVSQKVAWVIKKTKHSLLAGEGLPALPSYSLCDFLTP